MSYSICYHFWILPKILRIFQSWCSIDLGIFLNALIFYKNGVSLKLEVCTARVLYIAKVPKSFLISNYDNNVWYIFIRVFLTYTKTKMKPRPIQT